MPNFCLNSITITIDPESGNEGFELFKSTLNTADGEGNIVPFSFHQTIPRPTEENKNWYNWNNAHWGTKWDAVDPIVEILGDAIMISCNTAWTPPDEWAIVAAIKFKVRIEIDYDEIGMDLYGTFTATPRVYFDVPIERENDDEDDDEDDDEEPQELEAQA